MNKLILCLTILLSACNSSRVSQLPDHLKTAEDHYSDAVIYGIEADYIEKQGGNNDLLRVLLGNTPLDKKVKSFQSFQKANKAQKSFACCSVTENFRGCCSSHGGVMGCVNYRVVCKDGSMSATCVCRVRECLG